MASGANGRRRSGVLLHPTSLPEGGGLGPQVERWLDWLEAAGQGLWQLLPLGPPGPGRSPYSSPSSFAGDPGLTAFDDAERALPPRRGSERGRAFEAWCRSPERRVWLEDWALFEALRRRHRGGSWLDWPAPLRRRDPEALAAARRELAPELDRHRFAQFRFWDRWAEIRAGAAARGIEIVGDLPIYPTLDSADVWARQDLFDLDPAGRPRHVAGVPPDAFSDDGQLWGLPVYRWERHAAEGYRWWVDRLATALERYDLVRLDHFRGYAGFWRVPAAAATAAEGAWHPGPGRAPFEAARARLGELPLIAEDLGEITDDVRALRVELGLPGLRVLQFGFGGDDREHLPHAWDRDLLATTGTHDNDTCRGWYAGLDDAARGRVARYLGGDDEPIEWRMIRAVLTSVADLAVVPLQDVLGLGSEARMNRPGVPEGNWSWRCDWDALEAADGERLARLSSLTGRNRR